MKKNIYLLFFLFTGIGAFAQNLVVNPSFENTSTNCGAFGGEGFFTDLTGSWDNASNNAGGDSCSSPDLFSACNVVFGIQSPVHMPNSVLGYQYSRTGTRHAGIITHEALDEYREYIQGRTTTALVGGQTYCVSMYVSLGNDVLYATDNIGVYFGNTPYQRDPCPGQTNSAIYVTPQLNYDCGAITDTANWVRLQWNYTATGGERYFMIGNFFNNANTTVVNNPGGTFTNPYAYYYIDDVSIVPSGCCYADVSPSSSVCLAAAAFNLTATAGTGTICSSTANGTWSGTGITNGSLGTFNPTTAGLGVHTLTYTLSCGFTTTTTITVSACATLTVCSEPNGNLTVTGGSGPYVWNEVGTIEDCSACFLGCTFPPGCAVQMPGGWEQFATGVTITPSGSWPIQVIDSDGGMLQISGAGVVPACSGLPCNLELDITDSQGDCLGNNSGTITVAATGNIGAVSYSWNTTPGQNGATASGLGGGAYTVTATDQQGCQASITETITSGSITADAGDDQTICKGESVTLSANGGSSYVWDNGSGGTASGQTLTFSPSATTTYTVTVTGSGGCTDTDEVIVNVFQTPVVNLTAPTYQLCNNASPIQLTEEPTGGTFDGPGMTGNVFDPAAAGVGVHTITYSYYEVPECTGTDEVVITVDLCTGVQDQFDAKGFSVHPNPSSGFIILQNVGAAKGKAEFVITDLAGRTVLDPVVAELEGLRLPVDLSGLSKGQYLLNVLQDRGRMVTIRLTKE